MEIKEIVTYFVNNDTNILEVSFRTIDDNDDVLRTDLIDYSIVESYGFDLMTESFDFFDDISENEEFDDELIEIDEEELLSFLNEYYMVNPSSLPKPEIF